MSNGQRKIGDNSKNKQNSNSNNKKKTSVRVREANKKKEIGGIILIAVGIFLILSLFGQTGMIGKLIVGMISGLFGWISTIIITAVVFFVAWSLLRGTENIVFNFKRNMLLVLFVILLSSFLHTIFTDYSGEFSNKNGSEIFAHLWGSNIGGVIGGGLSFILQHFFEKAGALVILIPSLLVVAVVLFSLSVVNLINKTSSGVKSFGTWYKGVRKRFKEEKIAERKRQEKLKHAEEFKKSEKDEQTKITKTKIDETNSESLDDSFDDMDEVYSMDFNFVSSAKRKKVQKLNIDEEQIPNQQEDNIKQEQENEKIVRQIPIEYENGENSVDDNTENTDVFEERADETQEDDEVEIIANVIPGIDETIETVQPPKIESEFKITTSKFDTVYDAPAFSLLTPNDESEDMHEEHKRQATKVARKLEQVMKSFGVEARVIHISRGSTVTQYELQPHSGVKVSKIKNLSDDIALNLAAPGIRIEAPIPGKAAIGIEIPNEEVQTVFLRELIESEKFMNHKSPLAFCVGEEISGRPIIADIVKMPHLLIAGSTGSGKSVCINCMIMSILYKASPDDVRMIMIDPKVVELGIYNGIPHLLIPVVTEPKKAAAALAWAVQEMENRYKQFAKFGLREITSYNNYAYENNMDKMPRILIIIDELADLMMVARDSVEDAINRLAAKARAAGLHLVVATQRPSVDVITGLIKANIPSRIAFKVASQVDSRTILDFAGAEKLLGRGDMLYHPVGALQSTRAQGGFVSDEEIENVVKFLQTSYGEAAYDERVSTEVENAKIPEKGKKGATGAVGGGADSDVDDLFYDALRIAIDTKQISASFLQRKLGLGYSRASRIIDQLEDKGYISCRDGNNPRQVLVSQMPEGID